MAPSLASRSTEVQQLVDSLGKSIKSKSRTRFEKIRQNAIAAARSTTHSRTNQFAVRDQIAGLQEKAEILHRKDLAEALAAAVDRANSIESRWMPEHLSLLLQISDRPIDNTSLADLEPLHNAGAEKVLTWGEILRDDSLEDSGIWENVDFAASSSEDGDQIILVDSEFSRSYSPSVHEDAEGTLQEADVKVETDSLDPVVEWRTKMKLYHNDEIEGPLQVAETGLLQEVFSMLHGTPTDLFSYSNSNWMPNGGLSIEGLSRDVLYSILNQCAALGTQLTKLRAHSRARMSEPIQQTFLEALNQALRQFDSSICKMELRLLDQSVATPNTLLGFVREIRVAFQGLTPYAKICKQSETTQMRPLEYLDSLYDEAERQQSLGNADAFSEVLIAFEKSLQTFLKPILNWLYVGALDQQGLYFLTKEHNRDISAANFWSDTFTIVLGTDGTPLAPKFFKPFVHRIVGIGKTILFLQMLGETMPTPTDQAKIPSISFGLFEEAALVPFDESVSNALHQWISASQQRLERSLSHVLQSDGGLDDVLIALEHLYFSRDGACFDQAAMRLFERLKSMNKSAITSHILTGIYQDAFSACDSIRSGLISVRIVDSGIRDDDQSDPIAILDRVHVFYTLSWPMANILRPAAMVAYRDIHVLLLKLRIAKFAVDQDFGLGRNAGRVSGSRTQLLFLSLRHRLRWFLNTISSYLLGTVLPAVHLQLRQVAHFTGDLDDLITLHKKVTNVALKQCALFWSDSPTLKALNSMLRLAMIFGFSAIDRQSMVLSALSESIQEDMNRLDAQPNLNPLTLDESRLEEFLGTYIQLHGFIQRGVRDRSRSEGDRYLQVLAQTLSTDTIRSDY